ncbi:MAG TPA: hypothetical protein VNO81_06560 [Candidatus Nitrosotenuis sp.]|jgi:hypothetical protein|nr:hypothetical protein [Candidatus Nitrosotenuis sp.]
MEIRIDWSQEYIDYCTEQGHSLEDDPISRAALILRLTGLVREYNHLVEEGRYAEAGRLVRWLVVPTDFLLLDPADGRMYECVQEKGWAIRVLSGYRSEEVDLAPPELPEAAEEEVEPPPPPQVKIPEGPF